MKLHQKANYQCLTVTYKRCLKRASTGQHQQGNKEIHIMSRASNQNKYLVNKVKIPNDFGKLKNVLKSTQHSTKVWLRRAINLEKTNAQVPRPKTLQSLHFHSEQQLNANHYCNAAPNKSNLILRFVNRSTIPVNGNEICQLLLLLMSCFIQSRDLQLDLLGKVQEIKFFIICEQTNYFCKIQMLISLS